jgi:2,4-dienoyl-CoA reductase-like NADH-dependent reductase (Old Yellow Enzyme family)/NADPH-dependent 2,4-dienoyl-CoA reductase/sulfur reductase-like enzyme
MNKYPDLFRPIKLGDLTLRNRIFHAPMSAINLTPEGYLTLDSIAFFEARAAGGAAVITLGEAFVHTKTGVGRSSIVSLDDPMVFPTLGRVARAIKRHGAIPSIELEHHGKYGGIGKSDSDPRIRYGPSHEIIQDGQEVLEMPEDMILEIVDAYGQAAAKLKSVGFEMLMIHGGHGWLLHQFISPMDNKRKDKYGGSLENRARVPLMVIDSVRKAVGPGFPIEYRMSGDEFREGGYKLEDGIKFAKLIDGKVDLIHVSAAYHGMPPIEGFIRVHPTYFLEQGCNVYLAAAIKKEVKTPVACVGGITDVAMMENIVASGQADVVETVRALMADPNLPKKAAAGRTEEIRPCIRCLDCMMSDLFHGTMVCNVNPKVGRELENKFMAPPPARRKRVLIAGGGPGGMQAAITASERGHQVILCEKSSSLGGALKIVEGIPFLESLTRFKKYLEYMVNASGAVVMLNTEVTPELVAFHHPDVLIAAVGAEAIIPDIPGIQGKNVVIANDIHKPGTKIGKKVVIMGGGLVGCDEALYLAMQGKEVTIVEMLDDYGQDANHFIKMGLGMEFRKYNIKVMTNTKGKAVEEEGLLCTGPEGKEVLYKADTVVCAVGQKSLTSVVDKLRGTAPEFYFIGDCVKPHKITEAVTAGYDAAMDL